MRYIGWRDDGQLIDFTPKIFLRSSRQSISLLENSILVIGAFFKRF